MSSLQGLRPIILLLFCVLVSPCSWTQNSSLVQGRVLTPDGAPVAGASVYLSPNDRPVPGRQQPTTTKLDGSFKIEVPPGSYSIHAFKPEDGYADAVFAFDLVPDQTLPTVILAPNQNLHGVEVRLGARSAKVTVIVTSFENPPINSVRYVFCQKGRPRPNYCLSGSSGPKVTIDAPPMDISVEVSADGFATFTYTEGEQKFLRLLPGQEKTIIVSLVPTAKVSN